MVLLYHKPRFAFSHINFHPVVHNVNPSAASLSRLQEAAAFAPCLDTLDNDILTANCPSINLEQRFVL
jgi:hypothetical protein